MSNNLSDSYTSCIKKSEKFSAYNATFEPECQCSEPFAFEDHTFHKKGDYAANTGNDLLLGIWQILKHQAKWLTKKIGSLDNVDKLAKEISESLKGYIKDAIKSAVSESLKDGISQPQGNYEQLSQSVKDAVTHASKEIGDQNTEMLNKLSGIKEEIERALKDQNLDDKFGHTEKVIRDCIADMEIKLSKLQKLGRDILEEVSDSSGKTDMEKLVLENNKILKSLEGGNVGYPQGDIASLIGKVQIPGLEQLVKSEDVDFKTLVRRVDLKQEKIIEKLEQQEKLLKNFDIKEMQVLVNNEKREIEEILKEISEKLDRATIDQPIAEELAKAKEYLNKLSQSISEQKKRKLGKTENLSAWKL
ncbi:hypothetical protein Tsubulata_035813 [Turnera subulata]|uniref:SPFH domain-containing protein n=1 Tax=Turnera subulata TaxID=218843 RepID=A0A9Q0JS29_9ROSI|nr:hypothetical protein Tsubulata_035813 [Turnera subulata]